MCIPATFMPIIDTCLSWLSRQMPIQHSHKPSSLGHRDTALLVTIGVARIRFRINLDKKRWIDPWVNPPFFVEIYPKSDSSNSDCDKKSCVTMAQGRGFMAVLDWHLPTQPGQAGVDYRHKSSRDTQRCTPAREVLIRPRLLHQTDLSQDALASQELGGNPDHET